MGDLTPRPGWETCEMCEGEGWIDCGTGTFDHGCPDCVSGEVPSDGLVEAAVASLRASMPDATYVLTRPARAALLAARRHEDTARNTGVTP